MKPQSFRVLVSVPYIVSVDGNVTTFNEFVLLQKRMLSKQEGSTQAT